MRRHIVLEVTFRATVIGGDEYIPESTAAEESVMLTMPTIDTKYAVFPKVLEGVTLRTIQQLQGNVSSYLDKKSAEEKKRKEFEQMKLTYPDRAPNDDPDEWESNEAVTDDTADSDDEDLEDAGTDEESNNPFDDEPVSIGIDFSKIAKDAEAALRADGVDVEVNHISAELDK
jgi:hypothetical protein